MRSMLRAALSVLAVLAPAAAAAQGAATAQGAELAVSGQWMRALTAGLPAGGYFTLTNKADQPVRLVGASSPDCGSLTLHQTIHTHSMSAMSAMDKDNPHGGAHGGMGSMGGMSSMQPVAEVVVPAHGSIRFAPGGYHLMCEQPTEAVRPGQSIDVTLRFENGGTIRAAFPVKGVRGG